MKLFPLFNETDYLTEALIARVTAGEPIEVGDEFERIDLNHLLAHGNPYAMLIRVRGDSMSEEIHDGDWVMIDRSREAQPNDIVLANINGGYTIKRHKPGGHRGRNGLFLVPANEIHAPRKVTEEDSFEIIGVVTSVIHSFV
jgi:DNA polymerase V